MTIDIEEFEAGDSASEETNAERVGRFLLRHSDKAFKANEIAEQTGVNPNSIQPVLQRLQERGLVRHKRPYWALGDVEDVRAALAYHETAEFLDEKLGSERRGDWLESADDTDE
jgi:transcription initiation factor IIE alpha subunit